MGMERYFICCAVFLSGLTVCHGLVARSVISHPEPCRRHKSQTASASPRWFLMDMLEVGETLLAAWSPGSPTDSAPSLRTPSNINLELAQRISSSLHRDSARAILELTVEASCGTLVPPFQPLGTELRQPSVKYVTCPGSRGVVGCR